MVLSMEGQDKFVDVMANYDVDEIVKEYEKSFEIYESFETILKNYIQGLLDKAIQEGKLDKESVEIKSRTKEIESFKGKISRDDKKLKYKDPLSEITDLVGIKIMLTSLKDENIVYELLKLEMKDNIDKENSVDKTEDIKKERKFGYLGRHLVVFYDENMFELGKHLINKEIHPSHFKGLRAEIQIKTLLQHVWAEVEHKARYKAGEELSNDKKRYFDRLAALIEVADDLFKDLVEESEKINQISKQKIQKEQEALESQSEQTQQESKKDSKDKKQSPAVSSETIALYLANEIIKNKFKDIEQKDTFYILVDEEPSFVSMQFIKLLKEVGIHRTIDLERLFKESNVQLLHKYAKNELKDNKYKSRLQKLSVLQILVYCEANAEQRESIKNKHLIVDRICRAIDQLSK
ncbi:GTP pyrophosphokinase [Helicobacter pullorum]|uniref:GTP pyrophosphokinase n=1 Tax=Helicobacter pullorum TaxID=35818 RepID=UPI001D35AB5C|nr:hypothetical protein [Helicobacter pullorum]HJF83452.1 hypothetical protein [Helicobacter pullorum]